MDIFENGFLYRKVLIEYFQKMYRFNTIGHTVDEINAFEMSKKNAIFLLSQHFFCISLRSGDFKDFEKLTPGDLFQITLVNM